MWDSGNLQKRYGDLLVTVIWWTKVLELQNSFKKSEEDVIPEVKDPLDTNFVTMAT